MLDALKQSGMTQAAIARECQVRQPTICRAYKGVDVRYSLGQKIEALYVERVKNADASSNA
ncbi:hypothetical protein [Cobetia sp. 29-18-1]|uniref:hypothetical protein n=1 Tax=Cobetia sp. 29-18-1 TaxID=3040018 RepID=UPI00244B7DCA|nr:hypothetical protein [Cobetia sp. 29-18-1]MDH2299803.1 hypothetical protein [Cobetia sp. 29-18-1]